MQTGSQEGICAAFRCWKVGSDSVLLLLTVILWKVVNQMRVHDLLLQQVLLVEEENDRGVLEPGVCDYCPKQSFTLLHPVLQRECVCECVHEERGRKTYRERERERERERVLIS